MGPLPNNVKQALIDSVSNPRLLRFPLRRRRLYPGLLIPCGWFSFSFENPCQRIYSGHRECWTLGRRFGRSMLTIPPPAAILFSLLFKQPYHRTQNVINMQEIIFGADSHSFPRNCSLTRSELPYLLRGYPKRRVFWFPIRLSFVYSSSYSYPFVGNTHTDALARFQPGNRAPSPSTTRSSLLVSTPPRNSFHLRTAPNAAQRHTSTVLWRSPAVILRALQEQDSRIALDSQLSFNVGRDQCWDREYVPLLILL